MKKLLPFLLGMLLFTAFTAFTIQEHKVSHKRMNLKQVPPGYYITTFSVPYGPDSGIYKAYADADDHSVLLYVRNAASNIIYVTGGGSEATATNNIGHYDFTFDHDPTQEYHGFVYDYYNNPPE